MTNRKEELDQLTIDAKEQFLAQESADSIKDYLKANGAYQRDADRIYHKVKREVRNEFSEKAEALFVEGKSEAEVLDILGGQLEEHLLSQAVQSAKSTVMRKVQQAVFVLHDRGHSVEQIIARINSPLLSSTNQVQALLLSREIREQQVEESSGSNGKRVLGAILMIVGIVITAASVSSGSGVITYGLIIWGFIMMITG